MPHTAPEPGQGVTTTMHGESREGGTVAVLADIHGNSWALKEVLRDIARRGARRLLQLGDALYGPLDPAGAADMLISANPSGVAGNQDRLLLATPRSSDPPTLRHNRRCLEAAHRAWLAALPATATTADGLFLCHGTPERDDRYLLMNVHHDGASPSSPEVVASRIGDLAFQVLLCGHDHLPRTVRLPGRRLVVNPGSVGLPAYEDELPFPHAMESGSPHARYAFLTCSAQGWEVEHVAVPYDWEQAASVAERNGRPDWAGWLRTGRCATLRR